MLTRRSIVNKILKPYQKRLKASAIITIIAWVIVLAFAPKRAALGLFLMAGLWASMNLRFSHKALEIAKEIAANKFFLIKEDGLYHAYTAKGSVSGLPGDVAVEDCILIKTKEEIEHDFNNN